MRYADVLLMYAEAKIELNEIDDATLEAMNRVRARAYGVQYTETDQYPAIVTRSQSELRTILRTERRMEFAFERLRIYDLLRWRIAEKVLNYSDWTIKYNAGANVLKKVMTDGQWFIPTPAIDESGCPGDGRHVQPGKPPPHHRAVQPGVQSGDTLSLARCPQPTCS